MFKGSLVRNCVCLVNSDVCLCFELEDSVRSERCKNMEHWRLSAINKFDEESSIASYGAT